MLRRLLIIAMLGALAACSERLDGSNQSSASIAKSVTISQAKQLAHNTQVILKGKITSDKGGHLYTLADSTGQIPIEISVAESNIQKFVINTPVEITGTLDYKPAQGNKVIVTKLVNQ